MTTTRRATVALDETERLDLKDFADRHDISMSTALRAALIYAQLRETDVALGRILDELAAEEREMRANRGRAAMASRYGTAGAR